MQNAPGTALVSTAIPVATAADWDARAAWWANRVLFWTFEAPGYRDQASNLDNCIEGMRDSRRMAAHLRIIERIRPTSRKES